MRIPGALWSQSRGFRAEVDKNGRIARIVNNYSGISFNFGPTLLSWLAAEDPETYHRILEADKESQERFSGHGSALAQAYNHAILPLCNTRDKFTQISWGIRDFSHRFGRLPEGMWIPETAVDIETLDLMAQMGIRFAILAPHQAKRIRKRGERTWQNTSHHPIDSSQAYEICLPTGRRMALFFYYGEISLAVGFQKLLSDGNAFVQRLLGAIPVDGKGAQLVHIAVDGETFGHHHRFGDMALAYALDAIETHENARLTNYGEFLEKHPPTHLVEIYENSAWSCPHETGRWKRHCGCNTGAHPEWQQEWRAPLRKAMDWLRDHLAPFFDDDAVGLVKDPWAARNDYIEVILNRSAESIAGFLSMHQRRTLSPEEQVRTLKLMELQRHAMLMFTSCGWFFDDISGIETIQILQYACRAMQLGEELFCKSDIESSFLDILVQARSNVPEIGNGRTLYNNLVKPAMIDPLKVAGIYAVRSLFQDLPEPPELYSYLVDRRNSRIIEQDHARLAIGRCRLTSKILQESSDLEYAVVRFEDSHIKGGVRAFSEDNLTQNIVDGAGTALEKTDMPAVVRSIDENFGQFNFSIGSLLRDEQRRILDLLYRSAKKDLQTLCLQAYERTAPIMNLLTELQLSLPAHFQSLAAEVLHSRLIHELQSKALNANAIAVLLKTAAAWSVAIDKEELEQVLRKTIEGLACESLQQPGNLEVLRRLISGVRIASTMPFAVNFYQTQTLYFDMRKNHYSKLMKIAETGGENAQAWIAEFKGLGSMLSIKEE